MWPISPAKPRLIEDINTCRVGPGQGAFWWLGQHGFVLKLGVKVIYADPFLTDLPGRRVPPLLRPAEVTNADIILGSHDHADHIDRQAWPGLAQASPWACFIVPELLRRRLAEELGIDPERFRGADDGAAVTSDGVEITGIAAAHEFLDQDPVTGRYPYLGFIIRGNGVTVYHAGDTCLYEGLLTKLRRYRPDLVLVPINGRDAARLKKNIIGNMTYQEAADLAGALRPRLTVPAHFEMFEGNAGDPGLFVEYMHVKYPEGKSDYATVRWKPGI